MKKKTEIQQIDFYGILSRVPAHKDIDPIDSLDADSPEYLDLLVRSQIHGFASDVEVEKARDMIGHDHIPLRSIRVPIVPKLSSAWAPNGYGKTYIFLHMQELSNSFKQLQHHSESLWDYTSILQNSWNSELEKLQMQNPTGVRIVPYHSMGIIFRHEDTSYGMVIIFEGKSGVLSKTNPNSVFIRRLNTTEGFENFEDEFDEEHEIDIIEEGWAYQHCGNWTQMKPDRINGQNDANSEKIALYALKELTKMAVTYHETPDSSEKKVFDYIIKTINKQPETEEFKHVADWSKFGEIFNQPYQLWDSNEKMHSIFNKMGDTFDQWAGDSFGDFQLVEQLDYLAEVLDVLTNPMIMHSDVFDGIAAKEAFESMIDNNLLSLSIEQMNGFTPVLSVLYQVRRILFTHSTYNQDLRRKIIHQLLIDIEEYCDVQNLTSHPLRTMLDVMLMEYDYEFNTAKELIHSPTKHTAYSKYWLRRKSNPESVKSDLLSPVNFSRNPESNIDFFYDGESTFDSTTSENLGFVDLWPFCFDPDLPNGLKLAIPAETSSLATNEWMRTWKDYLVRRLLNMLRNHEDYINNQEIISLLDILERYLEAGKEGERNAYEDAVKLLNITDDIQSTYRKKLIDHFRYLEEYFDVFDQEDMPNEDLVKSVFSRIKLPLKENIALMQEEINRCLFPDEEDLPSAWGVETFIEFDKGPFQLNFRPQGMDKNTIDPRNLSFGMRSDITLQFILSRFSYECRRLNCNEEEGFQLLIIDEPEIGRAEHWVNLLIARLRRFNAQLSDETNGGVLVVSHRSKVLEQASPHWRYTLMQKIPLQIEDEMDDDF